MQNDTLTLITEIDTKGVEKGFQMLKSLTKSAASEIQQTADQISGAFKKMLSVLAIGKIFNEFRKYLDQAMRKNRDFAVSMRNLKGSIATAFQPIYEAIAPAIIYLVKLLDMVVQAIGRFIAAISGKSYSQMMQNAKALAYQKDQMKALGGAAADTQRQLMGFDEINKLQPPSGNDPGMSFNEQDLGGLSDEIKNFAETLRQLFIDGKFRETGEYIAEQVNNMIDKFDATEAAAKVGQWATNIMQTINGFVYSVEWNTLGGKFAAAINSFLKNFDGKEFGQLLQGKFELAFSMLTGFLRGMSLSLAGTTLGQALTGFTVALKTNINNNFDDEFWSSLNKNIDEGFDAFGPYFNKALGDAVDIISKQAPQIIGTLGNIGEQLIGLFSGAIDYMNENVAIGLSDTFDERGFQLNKIGTRWEQLGNSVAEVIKNINWANILTDGLSSASNLVVGLLSMLTTAFRKIEWDKVGASVIDGISSINWKELFGSTVEFIQSLTDAFIRLILGAIDTLFDQNLTEKYEKWRDSAKKTADGIVAQESKNVADTIEKLWETPEIRSIGGGGGMAEVSSAFIDDLVSKGEYAFTDGASRVVNMYDENGNLISYIEKIEDKASETSESIKTLSDTSGEAAKTLEKSMSTAETVTSEKSNLMVREISSVTSAFARLQAVMNGITIPSSAFMFDRFNFDGFNSTANIVNNIPRIPHLAKGGVIPPNNEFLAVLGDQKRGTNIEAPVETIQKATVSVIEPMFERMQRSIAEAIADAMGSGMAVYLDGQQLASSVAMHQRRRARAAGL